MFCSWRQGFCKAIIVLGLVLWGMWLAGQAVGGERLSALLNAGRYAEVVARIDAERDAQRRAAGWEWYAEHCIERAEKAYDEGDYALAVAVLDSALVALRPTEGSQTAAAAYLWSWKAIAHRQQEQYSEVLEAYDAAIGLYERLGENGPHVAYCYKNAAQVFIRRQDYRAAEQYLQAALRSDSTGYYQLSICAQLVNNAYWQDSLDKALRYAAAGMRLKGPPEARASLLSASAQVHRRRGEWAKARRMLAEALAYYQGRPDEAENVIRCLAGLANVAAHTGQAAQAERYFREAEQWGLRVFRHGKSREMAKLYCEWGDWAMQQGRLERALQFYQRAMQQVFPGFVSQDINANPSPENVPVELWAMNAAARKANALLLRPDLQRRLSAAQGFDLALAVADRLRSTYGTDEAKIYFLEHNIDLLREAVHNQWALYQMTHAPAHLEHLFDLLERGRANALRDALYRQRALALAGVPDSLLRLEEALRRERAATQAAQLQAESRGDSETTQRCQSVIFRLERRYAEVLRQLHMYPRFRGYMQADRRASLQQVQAALPDTTALLLYFDAGDMYLGLSVMRHHLKAWVFASDTSARAAISYLCRLLPDRQRSAAEPKHFFRAAFEVRQHLLPDTVLASVRSLIVVPDGLLAHLPFEVLLTRPHSGAYGNAPYLLRTCAVRYTWSASFVVEEFTHMPVRQARLLQIAPFVGGAHRNLSALPYARDECPADIIAHVLAHEQATATAFLEADASYDVLHLSTHAQAGANELTGIEFYDRALTLPEIYARRLWATLVALSACQTNAGVFAQGEGVLSLARAFAYAGAHSLVASYWSVNDRSTAQLFTAFYHHLKEGASKSEALRQARLDVLSEPGPDARKSPYYWAAFTLMGADGKVAFETTMPLPTWLAGIMALFLGWTGWVLYRRFRRRTL